MNTIRPQAKWTKWWHACLSVVEIKTAVIVTAGGLLAFLMYPADPPAPVTQVLHKEERAEPAAAGPITQTMFFVPPANQDAGPAQRKLFETDKAGALVIDNGSKVRLEIFVSQLPANMNARDLQTLESEVRAGLSNTEGQKAVAILRAYLAYVKAKDTAEFQQRTENRPMPDDGQALAALRRAIFGLETADALFKVDEAQSRFGAQLATVQSDATLSLQQKLDRIDELRAALPPEVAALERDGADAAKASLRFNEEIARLRRTGASEIDIQRVREQQFGVQGAKALAEMEMQKNDWERRYLEFLREKNAVLASSGTGQQKRERIELAMKQIYSHQEIDFARAFDDGRSTK